MFQAAGHTKGNNHQGDSFKRRARCWCVSQRKHINCPESVGPAIHQSSSQEQYGDIAMNDGHVGPGVRYTPYAIPTSYQSDVLHKREQTHGNMERESKAPEGETEETKQDGTIRKWLKITIPRGVKDDDKLVLDLTQSKCKISFSGAKISVFARPSVLPQSVHEELKSKMVKMIKVIKKPSDTCQEALDLLRLHSDPGVMTQDTEMGPKLSSGMGASLQLHEENMSKFSSFKLSINKLYQLDDLPDTMQKILGIKSLNLSKNEVKSEGKLDKVKGLELEERSADTSPDKPTNVSTILELFPKLLCLDGQESPRPGVCDAENNKKLPTCKGSIFGSETLQKLIMKFLTQYYWIYDYGDRQGLLGAYHNEACFSLTILFNAEDPDSSSLVKNTTDSRDMEKCKRPDLMVHLLKHTKRDIVDFLSVLPRTKHDLSSFLVDVCVQTEKMLCFSVNGIFKEVEGMLQSRVCTFTRIFVLTFGSNSNLCIMNEQLSVRNSSTKTWSVFSTRVPTPSSHVPGSTCAPHVQDQQEMM